MPLRFRIQAAPTTASQTTPDRTVEAEPVRGELRFGRQAGVDIALPFPTVSVVHARLCRRDRGNFTLEDLGSANGTFVNGERLGPHAPRALEVGATFFLANVGVTFEGEELGAATLPDRKPAESTATLARRLVNDLFQALGGAEVAKVVVTGGPGVGRSVVLAIPDRVYKVGRAPSCDLALLDDDVSREHAGFVRRWEGVFVRDLGSKNGIEVAGDRVFGERRLHDGQSLTLGRTLVRVEDPEERYLRRMEAQQEPVLAAPPSPAGAPAIEPPSHPREPVAAESGRRASGRVKARKSGSSDGRSGRLRVPAPADERRARASSAPRPAPGRAQPPRGQTPVPVMVLAVVSLAVVAGIVTWLLTARG